jgi:UDP-N-acetylmuramoylalanine--D-glutamate ligase
VHKDMAEYIDAKKNIIRFGNTRCVLNADDETAKDFAKVSACTPTYFSQKDGDGDVRFAKDGLYIGDKKTLSFENMLLRGEHNRANVAAAYAAVAPFVTPQDVETVLATFGGVEHRIEFVRTVNGVSYYNSSIDTSPSRTASSLNSFDGKLIVLCGGYDKHLSLDPLLPLFESKAKMAIIMGDIADKLEKVFSSGTFPVVRVGTMHEAVKTAYENAVEGDNVILSPSAASFDMYKNFAERGNDYKNEINRL